MKRTSWVLAIAALFLALAAHPATARKKAVEYTGADAGQLVYSVGTIRIGMRFDFPYERVQLLDGTPAGDWRGTIEPTVGGAWALKIKNPDFTGFESGHVIVRKLPPGRYVIRDFQFGGSGPTGSYQWNSGTPFVIEFTIEPGKATYIGSFMRSPTPTKELTATLGYAGYFLIADRAARDLPIAKTKHPGLFEPRIQFTDVETFGSPALRSRALEPNNDLIGAD